MPGCEGAGTAERSHPTSKVRGGGWEELPHFEVKGSSREEQPHLQGAVAVGAQEGLEEILHVQGKRNPSKTIGVARGHQRADTLKP